MASSIHRRRTCGRFWQPLRSNGRTFRTNARRAFSMPRHRRINGSRLGPVSLPSSTSVEQPGERADCAAGFLDHALAYQPSLGIRVERVLTDNSKVFDSGLFVRLCQQHRIKRPHTRYYRPQTNGKAERFIQIALREWAYRRTYRHSRQRTARLPRWVHEYNRHRPHSSLGGHPPISRLQLTGGTTC